MQPMENQVRDAQQVCIIVHYRQDATKWQTAVLNLLTGE